MKKMRYCFNCGAELGVLDSFDYDSLDTCGKSECIREAQSAERQRHDESHEQLDRDMGWDRF